MAFSGELRLQLTNTVANFVEASQFLMNWVKGPFCKFMVFTRLLTSPDGPFGWFDFAAVIPAYRVLHYASPPCAG